MIHSVVKKVEFTIEISPKFLWNTEFNEHNIELELENWWNISHLRITYLITLLKICTIHFNHSMIFFIYRSTIGPTRIGEKAGAAANQKKKVAYLVLLYIATRQGWIILLEIKGQVLIRHTGHFECCTYSEVLYITHDTQRSSYVIVHTHFVCYVRFPNSFVTDIVHLKKMNVNAIMFKYIVH